MSANFPSNPALNDVYTNAGRSWTWNGQYWQATSTTIGYTGSRGTDGVIGYNGSLGYTGSAGYIGSKGESSFTFSSTAPSNPVVGDRWLDSVTMAEVVWTNDGDSNQWVEVAGTGFLGQTGYTGSTGSPGGYTGSASTVAGYTGSTGGLGYTGSASTVAGYTGSTGGLGYTGSASTVAGYTGSASTVAGSNGYTGSVGGQLYVMNNPGGTFAYTVDGFTGNYPTLTVIRGELIYFDLQNITSGHPLAFRLASGDTSAVPGMVNNNPSTGNYATTTLVVYRVPYDAPNQIVYQCIYHSSMIGYINVQDKKGFTGSAGSNGYTGSAGVGYTGSGVVVGTTDSQSLTNKTLVNPTITNYTETRHTATVTSNSITLDLANGTFQTITTMAGANAITLPTPAAGKSLTVQIVYASTPTTLTFSSPSGALKYPSGATPTPTLTNTKIDFYAFVSDGTNWYGNQSGANF